MKNCDICANDFFRESWKAAGVSPRAFQPPTHGPSSDGHSAAAMPADQESLIQAITDRVMTMLETRR